MIDKLFIDKVKSALNIVNVVESFTNLQKAGINYKGICPFHNDSHPSMVVSPVKQTCHCFVCGAGGDVIEFVKQHLNLTFPEALRWCANLANIEFPEKEMTTEEEQRYRLREANFIAIEAAAKFYRDHLSHASDFLSKRGYKPTDKAIADYGVGYAPKGNVAMKQLTSAGYSAARLKDVGVVATSTEGYDYDFFNDRLVFPFYDLQGHIVGFSGRMVTPRENTGKYINTGETALFTKGKHLFGLYQARKAIGKKGFVYLVEGQFDVLSLHASGVENVIAGSGTAFTDEQVRLITRFTQQVVMVYDADPAGIKAALKNCELLLKTGVNVKGVRLPKGKDPDDFARENKAQTEKLLKDKTETFPKLFKKLLLQRGENAPDVINDVLNDIASLVANVQDATLRMGYMKELAKDFEMKLDLVDRKVRDLRRNIADVAEKAVMQPGLFGMDMLQENVEKDKPALLTSIFQDFLDKYGDEPIIYVSGVPMQTDIQELRKVYGYFVADAEGCTIKDNGEEGIYLRALREIYCGGVTNLSLSRGEFNEPFINFYIRLHGTFLDGFLGDKVPVIARCIELTSYAEESVVTINKNSYCAQLGITKGQFDEIRKPFAAKRKATIAINMQGDSLGTDDFDPDNLPKYVEDSEEYSSMFRECKYFPRLNKKGEPVCYMFQNKNGSGFTQVGDFFMTPLLHIYSDDYEQNKRVLRINRRYYPTPLYIEVTSKMLLKKSSIEEVLINLEAVNFTNGEEQHWTKIREYMSRHFVMCSEVQVYGNQQEEGTSRKTDGMFFAFSNGIFHLVDDKPTFSPIDELGVVAHNKKNYYLPAFSTIYAGSGRQSDKYELISQLVYKEVPFDKRVSFEKWADLMNQVYKINDNGKWATLYAIMCAFRSNIHCIDRLFTAPFFMGPMSSGKTQIGISIRSLFISPTVPIFNLNTGTDAAMSTIMGTFRDVPVVLDEYNNKDISNVKFQALKGIVYDGDGKQKRRGVSGREIENDKVYAPVVICGQETPQRDDNALMSRVIICEVPKPKNRTPEETRLFEELKRIEDPNKVGLSNVLLDILALRPQVMDHFRQLKQEAYEELKQDVVNSGERDRLMKTVSLFLGMLKLIERHTDLMLPFTYEEFFKIAQDKIEFQLSLIRSTDKLAIFFNAMDVMIDTKAVVEGRDFRIEQPTKVTGTDAQGNKRTFTFEPDTQVMFIRLSAIFSYFEKAGMNTENTTLSTLEQNLRSHPSYIGTVSSHRFEWKETIEVARNDAEETMVKLRKSKSKMTSAIIVNYDLFKMMYNLDFRRDPTFTETTAAPQEEDDSNKPF